MKTIDLLLRTTGFNRNGRGYPDVSLLAVKYISVVGGVQQDNLGISPVSVFAGMVSLVNAQRLAAGKTSLGEFFVLFVVVYD